MKSLVRLPLAVALVGAVTLLPVAPPDLDAQTRPRTTTRPTGRTPARATNGTAKNARNTKTATKGVPAGQSVAAANVAGTWISPEWGEMKLTQTGNKIRGTYNHQNGRVEGTVRGNTVDMNWWEPNPADRDYDRTIHPERGQAKFTVKPQDGAMNGNWRYERTLDPRPDGEWNFRKVVTAQTTPVAKTGTKAGARTNSRATGRSAAGSRNATRPMAANRSTGAARR